MPNHQEQTDPEATLEAEIYSVSQEKDGTLKLSRRDFLSMALAVTSALLVAGCQTSQAVLQGQTSTPGVLQSQTTTPPADLPQINLYSLPDAGSEVVEILYANDIVILPRSRRAIDPGWVVVTTQNGKDGFVRRDFVDFTRAFTFTGSTPGAGSNSTATMAIGTPMPGLVYVVLTVAGAPTPALPITCPQYLPFSPTTTPSPIPTHLPQCRTVGDSSSPCLFYSSTPCGCFAHTDFHCTCVGYNPAPCPCVHHSSCGCVGYFSCGCVSYFPCSRT